MRNFQSYLDVDSGVVVENEYAHCYINGYCQRITISDVKDELKPKEIGWFKRLLIILKIK